PATTVPSARRRTPASRSRCEPARRYAWAATGDTAVRIPALMALRAIVFDFDGVIANSEPLHFRAYASVLAGEGVTLTEQDYYARYLGFDDVGAFAAIARDRGLSWSPGFVRTLVERKAVDLEALERQGSAPVPGPAD